MTNKEFEVMRKAQKRETNIAVLRELDSLKAEVKEYASFKISNGYGTPMSICEGILEIINNHMGEYEE